MYPDQVCSVVLFIVCFLLLPSHLCCANGLHSPTHAPLTPHVHTTPRCTTPHTRLTATPPITRVHTTHHHTHTTHHHTLTPHITTHSHHTSPHTHTTHHHTHYHTCTHLTAHPRADRAATDWRAWICPIAPRYADVYACGLVTDTTHYTQLPVSPSAVVWLARPSQRIVGALKAGKRRSSGNDN